MVHRRNPQIVRARCDCNRLVAGDLNRRIHFYNARKLSKPFSDLSDWTVQLRPASVDLAKNLSAKLGAKMLGVEVTDFPDGESKIRIGEDVRNKKIIVVQSTYPPVDKHFMQLLVLSHKLSEDGADVFAVVPYLGTRGRTANF